jgi:biotin carboxylase
VPKPIKRRPHVLLCDAAFSALPILSSLRRQGFRVDVCGSRPGDPGHALADKSFVTDYSDEEALRQLVQSNDVDYLVPGCTDVSYRSCARVAADLGLPGYDDLETTTTIHRKDAFRAFCRAKGFPIPQFTSSPSDLDRIRFPILVKPPDSFSGKGIVKVDSRDQVDNAITDVEAFSSARSVIFEEFIVGDLYSHSAFLRGKKVFVDFFVNEYCTINPYQVNSSHVSAGIDEALREGMRKCVQEMAAALSLSDGLVHTQFIYTGNSFHLIEITRRCPGDLYASLIERSLGVDYAGLYAAPFCGREYPPYGSTTQSRFISRHTVSTTRDCVFISCGLSVTDKKVTFVPLKRCGELLRAAPMDRAGIYFVEYRSASEMKRLTPLLKECVALQEI